MRDPYEVLGVPRNASEAEVKAAYKELVKKYHPDQYQGNPLAEFAEEKMAEINAAYDEIINNQRSGGSFSYSQSTYEGFSGVDYRQIRRMISENNITEAEQRLDSVMPANRNGEWHFLKGSIAYTRGWLDQAYQEFATASSMEPGNTEYKSAFNRMQQQRNGYMAGGNTRYAGMQGGSPDACDCMSSLCLADCCCECMGGDLIRCI